MAGQDRRVTLIINHGRQLCKSLQLLAHYTFVFLAFVGRLVQWMVIALHSTALFAQYTCSALDSVHRLLSWRRRSGNGPQRIAPSSAVAHDTEPTAAAT